jgi:hypothetical protein
MMISLNLRGIICYTPYSEPVWPKRRISVSMNHKLTAEEDTCWKESYQSEELCLTPKVLTKEATIR